MKHVYLIIFLVFSLTTNAQDKCDFSIGADFVSSYVWRGSTLAGTSIQPAMGIKMGGFYFGTWGSVDIAGKDYKEIDMVASYTIGNFTIGFSDYWADGEYSYSYFNFKKNESPHELELNLEYMLSSFPLTISWNTMFTGVGNKYLDNNGELKNAYSTYIETAYSFSVKTVNLDAALGISPWNSQPVYTGTAPYEFLGMPVGDYPYATNGFAVVNVYLKAAKDIKITDNYSLGLFGQLIFNPAKEDVFFVFGIKF